MSFQQHTDHFPESEEFDDSLAISDYLTLFTYAFPIQLRVNQWTKASMSGL